ncbi:MAG: AAA family ATPase [Muribaculaceae bacterium]|nr:AAA family ATPase [Muribaculaceae bacterium]
MKYFSLDTVISSFEDNASKTTDGFWGIMAILKSIDSKVNACTQYDINCQKVANILEQWFSVRQEYKNYNTTATWYVVFSAMWIEQLSMFLKSPAPNIYNVIAWMYQDYKFENAPSDSELLALFCKDTSIEFNNLNDLFDMSTRTLTFSDTKFTQSEKLEKLTNRFGAIGINNSIKCNGSYIVAEAGVFQRAPFTQTLYASTENYKCLIITSAAPNVYYPANFIVSKNSSNSTEPRQVIYFGAPGTGKSHEVNKIVKDKRHIRTTFHPDTDYSSFVGCYKPTMKDGKIEYAFRGQAFVNAYISAWKNTTSPFYLVIEEINRGNCAQIFGDIFQLLDRDLSGASTYEIVPDTDLKAYIAENLADVEGITDDIKNGDKMCLPSNLFIYATMNTSDQSLFPIDSAFKRRWDMRYTAIKPGEEEHVLAVNGFNYKWSSFIAKVNAKIWDLTKSEDKQLGYWFIKPNEKNILNWKLFVSKVIFYIWNDVVKDYATAEKEESPFGKKYAFSTFFDANGNAIKDHVVEYLDALEVEKIDMEDDSYPDLSDYLEDGEDDDRDRKDFTKYQINGEGSYNKRQLFKGIIVKYIESHPEMSASEVINQWQSLGKIAPHFIESKEENDNRTDVYKNKVFRIECKGETIFIGNNVWNAKTVNSLITELNKKDWGFKITEYRR